MGFILTTSSPRYFCSNVLAEGAVKIDKGLWEDVEIKMWLCLRIGLHLWLQDIRQEI